MSLITRCPACGTMFKLVPDQLRISSGWVRCGKCNLVFDAKSQLQGDADALAAELADAPQPPPAARAAAAPVSAKAPPAAPQTPPAPPAPIARVAPEQATPRAVPPVLASVSSRPLPLLPPPKPAPPPPKPDAQAPAPAPAAVRGATPPATAVSQKEIVRWHTERFGQAFPRPARLNPEAKPSQKGDVPGAHKIDLHLDSPGQAKTPKPPEDGAPARKESARVKKDSSRVKRDAAHVKRDDTHIKKDGVRVRRDDTHARRDDARIRRDVARIRRSSDAHAMKDVERAMKDVERVKKDDTRVRKSSVSQAAALTHEPGARRHKEELHRAMAQQAPHHQSLSFVREAQRRAFWHSPRVRTLLWLLLGLLAMTLAMQMALAQRDWLAAAHPSTAPVLRLLCRVAGCQVGPYRNLDGVVVESSRFTRATDNVYLLSVTLRNDAALPVAMPALDLTLSDAQGQPVLRRVILPAEWGAPAVLAAGGEFAGTARLAVGALPDNAAVIGYRVEAFYP